jgi:NADPH:quinone reductase-like Zn-dependent oxidoreductase
MISAIRPRSGAVQAMKDIRIHEHGGPEQLAYDDAPNPIPRRGEALVRVASGITSRRVVHRQTKPKAAYKNSGTNRQSHHLAGNIRRVSAC